MAPREGAVLLQDQRSFFARRAEMVIEDHHHALGIAHRPVHLFVKNPAGQIAAEIMQEQAIDVGDDDFARLHRLAAARARENFLDHVHTTDLYLNSLENANLLGAMRNGAGH